MEMLDFEPLRNSHPVDTIEGVAAAHDWAFERCCDDEIALAVEGHWCEYAVSFSWMEAAEALHFGCAFDMAIPDARRGEVMKLVAAVNARLVVGHFDLWAGEGAVVFRHALLLCGGAEPTEAQAERLLGFGLEACERFFQAFQYVAWGGKSSDEALSCALLETVGEA